MKPVLRYLGSKHKASYRLLPLLPHHVVYCEPYGGSAGLLTNKPRSAFEYYNEIDPRIYNLFQVIKHRRTMLLLCEMLQNIAWSKSTWEHALDHSSDPVEDATNVLVRSWMSFSPIGIFRDNSGFRAVAKEGDHVEEIWESMPNRVRQLHIRIKQCRISNIKAIDFINHIEQLHGGLALYYVDPPYVHSCRVEQRGYSVELDNGDHRALLNRLLKISGKVLLSGYENSLYNTILSNWNRQQFDSYASSRRGSVSRQEMVWMNYQPVTYTNQDDLFSNQTNQ